MNQNQLKKILMLGEEGQNIEFKKDCSNIDSIGKVICGFLNSSGGFILCGISDNSNLIGVDINELKMHNIEKRIQQHISPKTLVSFDINEIEGKNILVIEVPSGKDIPYAFRDIIYIRDGDRTQIADVYTINDMVLSKQVEPHRWERRFSIANINEDIELDEINNAVKEIKTRFNFRDIHNPNWCLEDLSVARYGRLTNAGDVIFCKNPAERYPQVRVRASCYISDKSDKEYKDLKSFEGPLISVLKEVFHFIQRNTATRSLFNRDGLRRQDESIYPADAIREGLVNAFVHRDYSDFSGGIIVNIYPKYLEIYNTGSFPEGVTPDKLSEGHISVLRNPDIAHVVYLRGLMEKTGRGSVLIQRSCIESGLPLPKWTCDDKSVTLTFFTPEVPQEVTPEVPQEVTPEVPQEVTPEVIRILRTLKGKMSRRDIQEALNLKDAEHFRKNYILPAIENGFIEMTIPEKPQSSKQKYQLTLKGRQIQHILPSED